ncbi:RNA polymerase II elongation factor ELL [Habropoda laboriosa]|uniref:RNA polymerase II elongation factor ELL n=1 Tax=Habropoda laboriosa TaxID=597456 RepID=A0A0L7RFR7_9HYME|nr:RNA polymerase II elongation factor ELL [Habropoda laboriosa]
MRIQANDDVYETTRHRMAVAEENNKNKCTRVIKPNGPDIGRKVKVKVTGRTIPSPSNSRHRESTSIPTSGSQPRLSSSYKPAVNNPPPARSQPEKKVSDIMRRPLNTRVIKPNGPDIGRKVKVKVTGRTIPSPSNSRHRESTSIPTSGSQPRLSSSYKPAVNNPPPARSQPEKKVSDIMRRPLKERLIHLLALRPYKKPELYDRINREGIKDRERNVMTVILKQVAFMRDNTYHLHRYVWNDVQEDWPYYTEQEKAMLKRRKPQNLTPPGSSDGGSSGSGQSPNSTHPGSPPAITAPPPSLLSSKRPGYYQGNDGLPTKRPRISHYKKPEPNSGSSNAGENGRTAGSVGSNNNNSVSSVVSGGTGGSYSGSSNGVLADRRDRSDRNERNDRSRGGDRDRESRKRNSGTGANSYNDLTASDFAANGDSTVTTSTCLELPESPKSSEYPDYLTYYTTISSAEQRRRYKAEFNADYEEYRRLHAQVAKVSKRFTQLQDRLKQEEASGNWAEYEEIRRQILQEYNETKRDPVHKETKRRFHYLHEKLSHIKRLVLEYDTQNCGGSMMTTGSSNADSSNEMKEMDSLHY